MGTHYTAAHWGAYEVEQGRLRPAGFDPDPSPIGLDQLDEPVLRLRVQRPAVRRSWLDRGPGAAPERRGHEPFVEVGWDQALDLVAGELRRMRDAHGNGAIFGGSYGWSSAGRFHHAQSQVHRFLNCFGGYVRHVDTYSLGAGRAIMPFIVGEIDDLHAQHTSWDVLADHTELFVAFGGVALKNSRVSPGGATCHGVAQGLERMAARGVRFVNVSPVRDTLLVDGGAVEWIPIRPNTDTAMMLALMHELVAAGRADEAFLARCTEGYAELRAYLLGETDGVAKTADWAAAITGVPATRIRTLARQMADTRTMVNVAWSLQRAHHGEQPFWATVSLAAILGQVGLPGGGFALGYGAMNAIGSSVPQLKGPTLPQGHNPVRAFIPVARIADMLLDPGGRFTYRGRTHRYPHVRLLYWAGGNPFHHHQDLNRLQAAFRRPETIVVHEQYWTAAARMADVVLPATIAAERDDISFAVREPWVIAMRQVVLPHAEARDDYAIFRDLSARLGTEPAFTEGLDVPGWLARLYATFVQGAAAAGIAVPDFSTFWQQGAIDLSAHRRPVTFLAGFRADPTARRLTTPTGRIELFSRTVAAAGLADCPGHAAWLPPAEWLGAAAAQRFPLHLVSDQPATRLHSQLDHAAYSMQAKDGGRERVMVNPADATARGIAAGEVVELFNARGRMLAVADVTDGVMPGVLRMATGAWTDPAVAGADAHGNPNILTPDLPASGFTQGCAALSCLVDLAPCRAPTAPSAHRPPEFAARGTGAG